MAKTSSFGFTNVTENTNDITPFKLGLLTNYSAEDAPEQCEMNNKTTPIDVEELITYRAKKIPTVNTDLNIQYPSPVKSGVQYQVMIQDTLSTTDSSDPNFRVDEPIVAYLQVRHPRSGNITNAHVATVVTRLISSLFKEDGTWRFDDLMRLSERPVVD
jgi:hypothetical protein